MNLRELYKKYKDVLKESVNGNIKTGNVVNQADNLMIAESIEKDDSKIIDKLCFLLFVLFHDADNLEWQQDLADERQQAIDNGEEINEEDFKFDPSEVEIRTWEFNDFIKPPQKEKNTSSSTNYIYTTNPKGFSYGISSLCYDPKYPTRCYLTGTHHHPRGGECSIRSIFKGTDKAHGIPAERYYGSTSGFSLMPEKKEWPEELVNFTYPKNIPLVDQKWLFDSVLLKINRLNTTISLGHWLRFDEPDPTRRDRFITEAVKTYPIRDIAIWGEYKLLKKVLD